MFIPIKVLDIELSRPLEPITGLDRYGTVQALVRLHGAPIGYVTLPLANGFCSATILRRAILDQHSQAIIRHLLNDRLANLLPPDDLRIADLVHISHPVFHGALPLVTVAVCTRDRPADLARCLDSLTCLDYPELDLLVVDNAPKTDETEHLVSARYPRVRYIREPRPGLDWARNRAIREADGEIIAFTDDDVVVDPGWIKAVAAIFAQHPEVMLLTGLVVPYELKTEAQMLFERYGGFGRGFERKWVRVDHEGGDRFKYYGTGQFGTGANMAYRRCVFEQIGDFDPALDVGTVTNGGGDLEMFFRVLKEGHTLVYEPSAIVRHCHRRDYAALRRQITNNGVGLYSYFVRSALAYREERFAFFRFGLWWLRYWHFSHLLNAIADPTAIPLDLVLAELRGSLSGFVRYRKARCTATEIARSFDTPLRTEKPQRRRCPKTTNRHEGAIAIRSVELREMTPAITDVLDYSRVRIFVFWQGRPVGSVNIANCHQPISGIRLREAIANRLSLKVLEAEHETSTNSIRDKVKSALEHDWVSEAKTTIGKGSRPKAREPRLTTLPPRLSLEFSVSVVVATRDRPDDLRNCLRCLVSQISQRSIEIVVVDNNPNSGLTPPVVAEFPEIQLVNEQREGLAYARNAGIVATVGDIVIATDDDASMPVDWIERLVAPFIRSDVMIVTGNVLPLELETTSQYLFEMYGGLGRGFDRKEVDGRWFLSLKRSAVPTWTLGCTANAAFRASIFTHSAIGLMDEALGPGMPSGVGEDTYLFYKVLKVGYPLVYEPQAYVWHKHRRDLGALRHQLYAYSKGHVAYHITTLIRDRDVRALVQLGLWLPLFHLRRIKAYLRGWSDYPLSLLLLEIAGNMAGPWALWQSRRRVKREGRSAPYIPVAQRSFEP